MHEVNPKKPKLEINNDFLTSFVPMSAIDQSTGTITGMQKKPFGEVKRGYTYFEENDVLFAKITPCMQNKKSAIAKNLTCGFGFGTTEFHVLRTRGVIIPELLLYIIRRNSFIEQAKMNFTGVAGQQRVPSKFIEEFEVAFPSSKEEQTLLTKAIDSANAEIQVISCAAEASLNSLSLLSSSILNDVFGKIAEVPQDLEKR